MIIWIAKFKLHLFILLHKTWSYLLITLHIIFAGPLNSFEIKHGVVFSF